MTFAQNRRVLLIDDTPSIHDDFRKILTCEPGPQDLRGQETALFGRPVRPEASHFELDSAYDGREGVAMVEEAVSSGHPYALAFVDMRMPPGWDGVETIEALWRIDPLVQVVICTAYSDHPWEHVMARLDVRDRLLVVKKPFDLIEVSQLARTLTAKWDLVRQSESQIETLARAVQDLQASEAALRQSHKELETFAHSLSHDLRAPLTAMSSFSHLLAAELGALAPGKALHYLSRIQANAVVGDQLIDSLLLLDSVSRSELRLERLDLGALARDILAELSVGDPQRQVRAVVADHLWAVADRNLWRVALRQLLGNAWKFASGGNEPRIEVGRHGDEAGQPVFFVRDNGQGLDMKYTDKLFRTFQRLHQDSTLKGTGAGLAVTSRIVGRHGGRLWVDSALDAGATFYFTLPPASA